MKHERMRKEIAASCLDMNNRGINQGTSGNISARVADGWLMDYTREEGELHSLMLQSARTAVVVADHAKFGRFAPIRVGNFERVTHLITDRAPDPEIITALGALSLEMLVAAGSDGA